MVTIDSKTVILSADDILAFLPQLDGADPSDVVVSLTCGDDYHQYPLADSSIVLRVNTQYPPALRLVA
jgi:hypothetical protein